MSGFTLAPVEPVTLGVHTASWDEPGHEQRRRRRPVKYAARRRLLQAVAPGRDPDECDVVCEFGPEGELEAVMIRVVATGELLATLTVEQFARLSADSDQRGLLFERRG